MIVFLLLYSSVTIQAKNKCFENAQIEYLGNVLILENPEEIPLLLKENPPDRNAKLLEFILDNKYLKAEPNTPKENLLSRENHRGIPEKLNEVSLYLSDFLSEYFPERNATEIISEKIDGDYKKEIERCKGNLVIDKKIPSELNTQENPNFHEDNYELIFHEIPKGDDYKIDDIGIRDELVDYDGFSKLIGFFHPADFPLNLLQDSLNKNAPLHILILQIIKLEGLVLCWIIFWGIISICLPLATFMQLCCSKPNSHDLTPNHECSQRCFILFLYIIMLSLLCCILLMLGSNDKFSRSVEKLPETTNVVLSDVEIFIKNSYLQMNFATAAAFEQVAEKIHQDLKDVDKLLGVQFKEDLENETRLKPAIQDLKDLKSQSSGISRRVRELVRECGSARKSVKALQEALDEVSRQLNSARKYCQHKDRSLCESLQPAGLSLALNVDEIVANPTLVYFEKLHHNNDFNASIDEVIRAYEDIPKFVHTETSFDRTAIYDILQKRRRHVYDSLRSLEELSGSLTTKLKENSKDVLVMMENVASNDLWRYLAVVVTTLLIFTIWASLLCGSPCGCHIITRTGIFLSFGLVLMSITIIIVWIFGSISFIFGGHGQTIICNRLYEDNFNTLSKIFDPDGMLFEEGFFKHVLNSNETMRIEDVLKNCERNHTSYQTFHLENRIDINKLLNFKSWSDFRTLLDGIKFNVKNIRLQNDVFESVIDEYTKTNKLRELRSKISLPVTHSELFTFKQQIFSVCKQISNTKSANNYEEIILKMDEIIEKQYTTVKNFRDVVLYKLTAIEILYQPLKEKANYLVGKLRDAQQILNEKGQEISEKNIKNYVFRFERYLNDLQRYTNEQLRRKTAKCRPLWDIFRFSRYQVCNLLVDPLNALSSSYFITTIIFIVITPLIIRLLNIYRMLNNPELKSRQRYSPSTNQEQAVWNTPESGSPSNEVAEEPNDEENNWSRIPPPPKPPSLPAVSSNSNLPPSSSSSSESSKPTQKVSTLFTRTKSIGKPLKTRYDSLKYIEKTSRSPRPARSPRGWI